MKRTVSWGLWINTWCPCPLAIWAFALDGNLVKYCYKWSMDITPNDHYYFDLAVMQHNFSATCLYKIIQSCMLTLHTY